MLYCLRTNKFDDDDDVHYGHAHATRSDSWVYINIPANTCSISEVWDLQRFQTVQATFKVTQWHWH